MRRILAPQIVEEDGTFLRVRFGDGEADIYLRDDGMMASHISGRDPWDLPFRGAVEANWGDHASSPSDVLTAPSQREDLPDGIDVEIVEIATGSELLALIESR